MLSAHCIVHVAAMILRVGWLSCFYVRGQGVVVGRVLPLLLLCLRCTMSCRGLGGVVVWAYQQVWACCGCVFAETGT